jgi:hypothetical protein
MVDRFTLWFEVRDIARSEASEECPDVLAELAHSPMCDFIKERQDERQASKERPVPDTCLGSRYVQRKPVNRLLEQPWWYPPKLPGQ